MQEANVAVEQAKHTYVVTSYTEPQQVLRLVRVLREGSPDAQIVVSHDRKGPALDARGLLRLGAAVRITDTPVRWGDGSYLRSVLTVFSGLSLRPNDWVTLLTAQDYPLRPLVDFEASLAAGQFDTMLEEAPNDHLLERYRRRAYDVPRFMARGSLARLVDVAPGLSWHVQPHGLPPRVERRRLRTPFGPGRLTLRKGGDLYTANGRALEVLLNAPSSLLRYYDRCSVPSESFPHTVLLNSACVRNLPELLHYTRWERSAHPEWLSSPDLPEMLRSRKWFARKFRPQDPCLDKLDLLRSMPDRAV